MPEPLDATTASLLTLCTMLSAQAHAIRAWAVLAAALDVTAAQRDAAAQIAGDLDRWCETFRPPPD